MGQQQLLLLVVGIVVVGLAVVVGIQAFGENRDKTTIDVWTGEAVAIGSDLVAWQARPTAFGGNGGDGNMVGLAFEMLGFDQTGANASSSWMIANGRRITLTTSNAARPLLEIRHNPIVNGSRRFQAAFWGPAENCVAIQTARRVGNAWDTDGRSLNKPAGCVGW